MKVTQTLVLLGLVCSSISGEVSDCRTPTEIEGHCISIGDCEKLKMLIKQSAADRQYLMQWHCGYDGEVPRVCCPTKVPKDQCITLSGTFGSCVPIRSCPYIAKKLQKPVNKENLEYVQLSRCSTKEFFVCCDPTTDLEKKNLSEIYSNTEEKNGEDRIASDTTCSPSTLFPDRNNKCCGVDSSSGNRIIGGRATAIDAYPWLAVIEYSRPLSCGASLINGRYALTAAHCLVSDRGMSLGAVGVRLGDYNVANEGADCAPTDGGGEDCTEGAISIEIESTVVHPQYLNGTTLKYVNDIALIRLAKLVSFTDFIRPICLPITDVTKAPPANLRLYVAGWGYKDERHTSDVKLDIDLPLVDKEECDQKFSTRSVSILGPNQICAGGEENKDTCRGDSGGPLSYSNDRGIQEIVGITSFGALKCGSADTPSVYTKVYNYLDWIQSNVKP